MLPTVFLKDGFDLKTGDAPIGPIERQLIDKLGPRREGEP